MPSILKTALTCLLLAGPAGAITFDIADDLRVDFYDGPIDSAQIKGTLSLTDQLIRDILERPLDFIPIPAFDLEVTLTGDTGDSFVEYTLGLTPENTDLTFNTAGLTVFEDQIVVNADGLLAGTTIVEVFRKDVDDDDGFPNGRRGDEQVDTLLMALLSGSVNFGLATFGENGFPFDPQLVQVTQLTPDNRFVLATARDVTVVPLPASLWFLLAGVAALGAARHRRRGA